MHDADDGAVLTDWVLKAQSGNEDAYHYLLTRFQNMAVGYANAVLKDWDSAEDAAQNAFIEAFRNLDRLREPQAFPSWLRQIVWKHCDRQLRQGRLDTVPLDAEIEVATTEVGPAAILEASESKVEIWELVARLPVHQREAVVLFYVGDHSQKEIAQFLGVPVSTVVKRLQAARTRLKSWLEASLPRTTMNEIQAQLHQKAPSLDGGFVERVMRYIEDPRGTPDLLDPSVLDWLMQAIRAGDAKQVSELIAQDNGYGDPLTYWLFKNDLDAVQQFVATREGDFDIFVASFLGREERVSRLAQEDATQVHRRNDNGWTPLDVAAHEGHYEAAETLLALGADPNSHTPMLWAAQNGFRDIVELLLKHGGGAGSQADDALARTVYHTHLDVAELLIEHGVPVMGLLGMASYGSRTRGKVAILQLLLEHGAELNARDAQGCAAIHSQVGFFGVGPDAEITNFLLSQGAEVDVFAASGLGLLEHLTRLLAEDAALVHARMPDGRTALHYAAIGNQLEAAKILVAAGADRNAVVSADDASLPVDLVPVTDGHFVTSETGRCGSF